MQRFLAGSLIRYYDELCDIVSAEPLGAYENHHNHPAIAKILRKASNVGMAEDDVKIWCSEIQRDFITKNCLAMPLSVASKALGAEEADSIMANVMVDTSPLLTVLKETSKGVITNTMHTMQLQCEVSELNMKVRHIVHITFVHIIINICPYYY